MNNLEELYHKAVSMEEERFRKKVGKQQELRNIILESFDKERTEQLAYCAEVGLIPKPKGFWTWKCPYCKIKLEHTIKWVPDIPPSRKIMNYNYFKCNQCTYEYAEVSRLSPDYYDGWEPYDKS